MADTNCTRNNCFIKPGQNRYTLTQWKGSTSVNKILIISLKLAKFLFGSFHFGPEYLSQAYNKPYGIQPTPVIKTDDTKIANNKHFTKGNKVATRWRTRTTRGPSEDLPNKHAQPKMTAGAIRIQESRCTCM